MSQLSEDLIIAWMQLSAMMEKRALVHGLSFNEALVCNLIDRGCTTASALCVRTKILKSQMNAILRSLEKKGILSHSWGLGVFFLLLLLVLFLLVFLLLALLHVEPTKLLY